MGYTHYWGFKGKVAPKDLKDGKEKFATASARVVRAVNLLQEKGVVELAGGSGRGPVIINENEILFNGKGAESCESFWIGVNVHNIWDGFCKTERLPYDIAVCLTLLIFKDVFGDDFSYSSDGVTKESIIDPEHLEYWKSINWEPKVEDEWLAAYKFYEENKI